MGILELLLIAIGLSMDAFAVAVCHGLSMQKASYKKALIVGLYFGAFQAAKPLIGYFCMRSHSICRHDRLNFDHWIAFGLSCVFIGLK